MNSEADSVQFVYFDNSISEWSIKILFEIVIMVVV
jgi:hypothetical protein